MVDVTERSYLIQAEVPRVVRDGTTWRTITTASTYSAVGDLAMYLVDSMVLVGIDRALAREWASNHLRCVPQTVTTVSSDPEGMPVGP